MTEKECRICLQKDKIDEFIHPCLCNGTSKWVHRSCLDRWRYMNVNNTGYSKCMECRYTYKLANQYPVESNIITINNNRYLGYFVFTFIVSYPLSYLTYLIDFNNNYLSIKMVTYNDTELYDILIKKVDSAEFYFTLYYNLLTINIYLNVFLCGFLIYMLSKVHRKSLYFRSIYCDLIKVGILSNHIFYMFHIFLIMSMDSFYFFVSPGLSFLMFFCQKLLIHKNNKIINMMNTKFNKSIVLNYEESMEETDTSNQEDDDEIEIELFENLNLINNDGTKQQSNRYVELIAEED